MARMKFVYGKKQSVDSIQLDSLFTDLRGVLQKHPLVPAANVDVLVSEWINDLLFLAGKITEEELKEAMEKFESAETTVEQPAGAGAADQNDDSEDDEDDEDDEE